MFAATLPRERDEFLSAMLHAQVSGADWSAPARVGFSATRNILPGVPIEAVRVVPMHVPGNDRWPAPWIAACGECGRRPGEAGTLGCPEINCGLIGRPHSQEDTQ